MPVGAAVGAVTSIGGSIISANAQKDAAKSAAKAAEFRPYDLSIGGSKVLDYNAANQSAKYQDADLLNLRERMLGFSGLQNNLVGSPTDPRWGTANVALSYGAADYMNDFWRAQSALDPNTPNLDPLQSRAFVNNSLMWDQVGANNSLIAGGRTGVSQGMNSLLMAGRNDLANADGLALQRYNMLEQMANPGETNAAYRTMTNLFNTGRLGTTGGNEVMRTLNESMNMSRLGRQTAALDYGQNIRGNATNMLNSGFGQFNFLGNSMNNFANTASGLSDAYARRGAVNDSYRVQRAMDKLKMTEGLFGFGTGLQRDAFNLGASQLGVVNSLDQEARSWIGLGGNIGGQQAQAGANVGALRMQGGTGIAGALGDFATTAGGGLFNRWLDTIEF